MQPTVKPSATLKPVPVPWWRRLVRRLLEGEDPIKAAKERLVARERLASKKHIAPKEDASRCLRALGRAVFGDQEALLRSTYEARRLAYRVAHPKRIGLQVVACSGGLL